MEIVSVKPKPYEYSVLLGISFEVGISYEENRQAIIGITGWIQTDDGKVIAEVREEKRRQPQSLFLAARDFEGDTSMQNEQILIRQIQKEVCKSD